MRTAKFTLYGLEYSFCFDPRQDNPTEGPTLTYLGDKDGRRLAPSEHASEKAWEYAKALVFSNRMVKVPFVEWYPKEQADLAARVYSDMRQKGVPVQYIDGPFDLTKYDFD